MGKKTNDTFPRTSRNVATCQKSFRLLCLFAFFEAGVRCRLFTTEPVSQLLFFFESHCFFFLQNHKYYSQLCVFSAFVNCQKWQKPSFLLSLVYFLEGVCSVFLSKGFVFVLFVKGTKEIYCFSSLQTLLTDG